MPAYSFTDEAHTQSRSYQEFLTEQWTTLCTAMQFPDAEITATRAELRDLLDSWGHAPIGDECRYRSYVAADGFPAEFSLSWHGTRREVRILFESQGAEPTARAAQDADRALTRRLADRPGIDVDGYLGVEDLFITDAPAPGQPTVWHSLAHRQGAPSRYKVYLNPRAHGADRAAEVVGTAMSRLGLAAAWRPVAARCADLADAGYDIACYDSSQPVVNEPITCLAFRAGADAPDEANLYLRLADGAGHRGSPDGGPDPVIAVVAAESGAQAGHLARAAVAELRAPVARELLSYRTVRRDQPAVVGLYGLVLGSVRPSAK